MYSVWIKEPTLCQAFHDWMTHLPESELTVSAKETVEILERLAKGVERSGGKNKEYMEIKGNVIEAM